MQSLKLRTRALSAVLSTVCLSAGYVLLRRFRRRLNQSKKLRQDRRSPVDASRLIPGSYIWLRGKVAVGDRCLKSPLKGVPCVAYRLTKIRVVDSRTSNRKDTASGFLSVAGRVSQLVPYFSSMSASSQVNTESWKAVHQRLSTSEESVEVFLEPDQQIRDPGTAVGNLSMHPSGRVRLDLAGAEFFTLDKVAEEFTPDPVLPGRDEGSRNQLGYRTVEEVLAVGTHVVVLGEVSEDEEAIDANTDGSGPSAMRMVVQRSTPKSILDLKTTSITRSFVVTTNTEQALLQVPSSSFETSTAAAEEVEWSKPGVGIGGNNLRNLEIISIIVLITPG
ncbi:unnamed protein product [Choristocarpus tenellus]